MEIEHLKSYLSQVKGYLQSGEQTLMIGTIDEVIKCLEEGEKYKKMWEELESEGENYSHSYIATTKYLMDNIKQKYFPKPKGRWQKINDMVDGLNTIGHSTDIKELVNLLIELRDEEL